MKANYELLLPHKTSFQLLRTNPKLTGNVKLTIDSSQRLWLNSFDANEELAKDLYKKFPVSETRSHPKNIYTFFDRGKTPSEIIFDTFDTFDLNKVSDDYKDQYFFSEYCSGVKYLKNKYYEEKFSYFAPLYLNKDIPKYFVIFRFEGPMNSDSVTSKANFPHNTKDYVYELFKNSIIVETFDLTKKTELGRYIYNYVTSVDFPKSPLTISYNPNVLSYWKGIATQAGTFVQKGEDLMDIFINDYPMKYIEDYVLRGFERNYILYPNIMNLEFLFDDETGGKYEFNRYFGMYVNNIELDTVKMDLANLFKYKSLLGNYPVLRNEPTHADNIEYIAENPDGIRLPILSTTGIDYSEFIMDKEDLTIAYIQDQDDRFRLLHTDSPVVEEDYGTVLRTADTKLDIGRFFGPDDILVQDSCKVLDIKGTTHIAVNILDNLSHGDTFRIYYSLGSQVEDDGSKYDDIVVIDPVFLQSGQSVVDEPGDIYYFLDDGAIRDIENDAGVAESGTISELVDTDKNWNDDAFVDMYVIIDSGTGAGQEKIITANDFNTIYAAFDTAPDSTSSYRIVDRRRVGNIFWMNGLKTNQNMESTNAFIELLSKMQNNLLEGVWYDNKLIVKLNTNGDYDDEFAIKFISTAGSYDKVIIDEITGDDLIDNKINFKGGSDFPTRILIPKDNKRLIEKNIERIFIKTSNGWSRIKGISYYLDIFLDYDFQRGMRSDEYLKMFQDYRVLEIDGRYNLPTSSNKFTIRTDAVITTGILSMIPVKDFNYDFYDSEYTRFPIWELYNYFYIPANRSLLSPGEYDVIGFGSIRYDGIVYSSGDSFTVPDIVDHIDFYTVEEGDPSVIYGYAKDAPIYDEGEGILSFPGYFGIRDAAAIEGTDTNTDIFKKRDRFINNLLSTEYHYYKENFTKDFATKSLIDPTIVKWGMVNGTDARDNPYRLNTTIAFGLDNISPSHYNKLQDPTQLTHEWYYLEAKYDFINDDITKARNYCYFENSIDLDALVSEENEFLNYFVYTPVHDDIYLTAPQHRYSVVSFNEDTGFCETFFRGARIRIKDVVSNGELGVDNKPVYKDLSRRFEDYKYTTILRFVKEDINDGTVPPIRLRVIEHGDFKYILFLIEVVIGDKDNVDINAGKLSLGTYLNMWDTINGDYRVEFDNDVSNMSYLLLYSLRDKKYNVYFDSYSTIKLSSKFDFSEVSPDDFTRPYTVKSYYNENFPDYDFNVLDELKQFNDYNFLIMQRPDNSKNYFLQYINAGIIEQQSSLSGAFQNRIALNFPPAGDAWFVNDVATSAVYLIPNLNTDFWTQQVYKQLGGGREFYTNLLSKISFSSIKNYINTFNPIIEYLSYDSNGLKDMDTFYMEIIDPITIDKNNIIVPLPDENPPAQFKSDAVVGYELAQVEVKNRYSINRYQGNYMPIFRDILVFKPRTSFAVNDIDDIIYGNTSFNMDINTFGIIKNFGHLKISDSKILELQDDITYLPLYELIDEIAVDHADLNIFIGDWEFGFHKKYINKDLYSNVAGSLRIEEDDIFVNKVMHLPDPVYLNDYKPTIVPNADIVNVEDYEIAYSEDRTAYYGFINLRNVLVSYLVNDGADAQFKEFLVDNPEYLGKLTIDEYIEQYMLINIVGLYEIELVQMHLKTDYDKTGLSFVNLTDYEREELGYRVSKDVSITTKDQLVVNFRINKNIGHGISISPEIKIKLI